MSDLLGQLEELIRSAEESQADADKWRELVVRLVEQGYGPRITPEQVASLAPNADRWRAQHRQERHQRIHRP